MIAPRNFGRTDPAFITPSNPLGIDRTTAHASDDIGLTNVLVLPIDLTVVVQLTSLYVVHSFTLPEMRVKQDATPGCVANLVHAGEGRHVEIGCSQLCGLGHHRMRGEYRVISREAWDRWLAAEVEQLK